MNAAENPYYPSGDHGRIFKHRYKWRRAISDAWDGKTLDSKDNRKLSKVVIALFPFGKR